jgi:hypothetical protein
VKKAGAYPRWRERALAEIRLRITKAEEKAGASADTWWMRRDDDHSPLVEIFVYRGNPEEGVGRRLVGPAGYALGRAFFFKSESE